MYVFMKMLGNGVLTNHSFAEMMGKSFDLKTKQSQKFIFGDGESKVSGKKKRKKNLLFPELKVQENGRKLIYPRSLEHKCLQHTGILVYH